MNKKALFLIAIIVIFYSVGMIGTHIPNYRNSFFELSYFNLLLSFGILLASRVNMNKKFIGFLIFSFLIGMTVEWIGVHTGLLFGNYKYGENLGLKLFEVPLVIGLNWSMLTVITASFVDRIKSTMIIKIVSSAALMTLFDVLMEPVAITSDFWHWKGDIPLYNYVCWFIVSLVLQAVYFRKQLAESNKVHDVLLFSMTVFFLSLLIY
jgi:putative membrane protein